MEDSKNEVIHKSSLSHTELFRSELFKNKDI